MSQHYKRRLGRIDSGTPARGTLVAFHGVTDNAASLSDIATRLGNQWRVILIDALGHGLSQAFTDDDLTRPFPAMLDAALAEVHHIARTTPGGKVTLMGHSMGGALVTHIALRAPELVSALILDDPALLTPEQFELYRSGGSALAQRQDLITTHVGEAITELMRAYTNWPPAEYGPWAQGKVQVDRSFVATGIVGAQGRHVLAQLEVPTLLITGDAPDVLFGSEGIEEVRTLGNPHIHCALIPHTTHTVRRDASDAFFSHVTAFLDALPEAAFPTPYLDPELTPLIDAAPEQTTWDAASMRAAGDRLLSDTAPCPEGITRTQVDIPRSDEATAPLALRVTSVATPQCVVLSLHGGGYVAGRARFDDAHNATLAQLFDAAVYSPDYRLAPEDPFPAALHDCLDTVAHLRDAHPHLPLYFYGDSAGAGLAWQTLATLIDRGESAGIAGFVALEPCLDPLADSPSYRTHPHGPIWTHEAAHHAWEAYGNGADASSVFPLPHGRGTQMPPTFVAVNPADPLRDEGTQWAYSLADSGCPVELHMLPGTFHGSLTLPGSRTWQQLHDLLSTYLTHTKGFQR